MQQEIISDARISLVAKGRNREGRTQYHYSITIGGQRYENTDLASGCQGGTEEEGMSSLLCFLSACGESYSFRGEDGENSDLFPEWIAQWVSENYEEIDSRRYESEYPE